MILLEKLLKGLDVRVDTFDLCRVAPGAPLALEALGQPTVHYVVSGAGRLDVAAAAPLAFKRHSFVIVPAGRSLRVEAAGAAEAGRISRCGSLAEAWGESPPAPALEVVMACGRIDATYHQAAGLFDHLTEPLIDDFACQDGICRPFETLLGELAAPRPGSMALADSLMQQCLVLLLRRYCASGECRLPWLSALEDPRLGRAMAAMLEDPARDFSLEALAEIAGMSRSAFAAHFAEAFGRAPIDFLKGLRLQRAAELLSGTDLPVKQVAPKVGYASRSYFSRAFKSLYGLDPAAYRRQARGGDAGSEASGTRG